MSIRRPTHAGSWYSNNPQELSLQLDNWLSHPLKTHSPARAIIAPHAGFQYSAACSAYAYKQINPQTVTRIFILGPSHRVRLSGCALSTTAEYSTPFYNLPIDTYVNSQLEMTGHFDWMPLETDENEHSIEMHLPFIAKLMQGLPCSLIPVLVGSLREEDEALYGRIFANYLADPENLFVISSDFCHWGQRFHYTYYDANFGPICKSIEEIDRLGMEKIEAQNPREFAKYLKKYANTICGRHPIGILLQTIQEFLKNNDKTTDFKFLNYSQSNQCQDMSDSSVSYAAGSLVVC